MRENMGKYHGKRKDNGEWVEGSLITFADNTGAAIIESKSKAYMPKNDTTFCTTSCFEVIPETVGQFTGLTDRNGNKIFEGDIVAVEGENIQAVVKYRDDKAAFFVENDDEEEYFGEAETDVIVIGNIYDFCTEYHLLLSGDSNAD